MSFVAFGLSHRTAPLAVLEQVSVGPAERSKLLRQLCADDAVDGAVVLSTCNRIEVYLDAGRFHDAYRVARDSLADGAGLHPDEIAPHLALSYDTDTVRHLFSVAAGLDSAVLGEHEILGQVRDAWEEARGEGALTPGLDLLFRRAVEVGKQVRTDTAIGRGTASLGQAAVELAGRQLGGLVGRRAAVLGAGAIGATVADALAARGVADLAVVNRGAERAETLAAAIGARAVGLEGLGRELLDADVLVTAAAAPGVVVELELVERILAERGGRPIVLVDAGLPRNVDPAAASLVGRHPVGPRRRPLLRGGGPGRAAPGPLTPPSSWSRRRSPATWASASPARPTRPSPPCAPGRTTCAAPRSSATGGGWLGLTDRELEAVDALTRSLLGKLLHAPTLSLKEAAATPRGDRLAEAAAELFRLDP